MLIETLSQNFRKARSVNQTSASFVAKIPTQTTPASDTGSATASAAIDLGAGGVIAQNLIFLCPYGVGSENDTFSVRVIGWRTVGEDNKKTALWIPVPLAELLCTLSTMVGVAGMAVTDTERFCDTIANTVGNDGVDLNRLTGWTNVAASAMVDLKGCKKFELSFSTGSVATSCNALVALL